MAQASSPAVSPSASATTCSSDPLIADFVVFLKRRELSHGSYGLARRTVEVLREFITQRRWSTAKDLIELVRAAGKQMESGRPGEYIVGNMARRVLRLIRDSYMECANASAPTEDGVYATVSLHEMVVAPDRTCDYSMAVKGLRGAIMQAIAELLEELEGSAHNIATQALEHIHHNEIIMTLGHSRTVEAFLKQARKRRPFHVIVAESAPSFEGQDLAMALGRANIETTVITDSAIFAMMSRVNKVIIGTNAISADGGLVAPNGTHALTLAAKLHSVPVIVCAATFKLSPRYLCAYDQDSYNSLAAPTEIADFFESDIAGSVHLAHPQLDYVSPDLVNLFISNMGGNAPSYVYRMLSEYYHEDDLEL